MRGFPTNRLDSMPLAYQQNLLTKVRPILRKETARILAGDSAANQRQPLIANDKEFQNQIDEKWKKVLDLWAKATIAATVEEKDQTGVALNKSIAPPSLARKLTRDSLKVIHQRNFCAAMPSFTGTLATLPPQGSRAEGRAHWILKKDFGVSANDLLTNLSALSSTSTIAFRAGEPLDSFVS
jgi:hypothetical protein